jgi:hypothetical protein
MPSGFIDSGVELVVLGVSEDLLGDGLGSLLEGLDLVLRLAGVLEGGSEGLHVVLELDYVRLLVELGGV